MILVVVLSLLRFRQKLKYQAPQSYSSSYQGDVDAVSSLGHSFQSVNFVIVVSKDARMQPPQVQSSYPC